MTGYATCWWYRLFVISAWWYLRQEEPEDIYWSDFYGFIPSESDDIEEACFDERENKFFDDKFMKFLEIFPERNIELILVDIHI